MKSFVPVAGVDVSKRFSDLCVLSPDNNVLLRQKIYHDMVSMKLAEKKLHEIELECGARPVVVMESTSHYHLILFQFFTDAGFEVVVVNPIQSGALKNINVRKVKNDRVDAYRIAMLYRLKVLRPSQIPTSSLRGLRLLTRQRSELKSDVARFKNRMTAYLDQIFPGYGEVFSDVGGSASRAVLHMCPTPEELLNADGSLLAKAICEAGNKGHKFGAEKAAKLREAAGSAQVIGVRSASNASLIKNVLDIIEGLLAAIQRIEREIEELVTQDTRLDEDVKLLCSIPGIGFSSAVVIVAEMGDISLFRKPKQLAAYFGLDPGERQSGTFKGRKNKLSKRGSPQVRAALHMAAVSSVSRNRDGTYRNPVLAEYYERKCAEKPCKVARVAVMRKLSNIIYAVLRDRKPFELRTPQEHMALLAAA